MEKKQTFSVHTERDVKLTVEDIDEKWELDLEKFLNGFKLWVEQGLDEYGAVQKDGTVDCCQIDAACADEIVQLALFKEVMFG